MPRNLGYGFFDMTVGGKFKIWLPVNMNFRYFQIAPKQTESAAPAAIRPFKPTPMADKVTPSTTTTSASPTTPVPSPVVAPKKPRICMRLVVNCNNSPAHRCCQGSDQNSVSYLNYSGACNLLKLMSTLRNFHFNFELLKLLFKWRITN